MSILTQISLTLSVLESTKVFDLFKKKVADYSFHSEGSNLASPSEDSQPRITRYPSGLNYDQELAVPMPKPHTRRYLPTDENSQSGMENVLSQSRPRTLPKKRSMPDAVRAKATPEPVPSADGKKKSRLEALRSKLSFKDLHKEAAKDEYTDITVPPLPSSEKQDGTQGSTIGGGITGFTPSIFPFQNKPKPMHNIRPSAIPLTSPVSTTQHSSPPSRIPLAPSGTYTHAHGSMTPSGSSNDQQIGTWEQVKSAAGRAESKEKLPPATKGSIPIPIGKHKPSPLATLPGPGAFTTDRSPVMPNSPAAYYADYPPTGDSPPKPSDLTEGSGKVKYIRRTYVEKTSPSTPSPTVKSALPAPSPYQEGELSSGLRSGFMPGFEERLKGINQSLDNPTSPALKISGTEAGAKDFDEMVRMIQQRAESGISSLTAQVNDLSQWTNNEIKSHIHLKQNPSVIKSQVRSIKDLERMNNQLSLRQTEISQDIKKYKLDIDLDKVVKDRRIEILESKFLDEVDVELQNMALSMQEMTQKLENAIERFTAESDKAAKIAEKQEAHIRAMENEIAEMKQKGAYQSKLLPPALAQRLGNQPASASAEPLLISPESPIPPVRISPLPRSMTAAQAQQRESSMAKGEASPPFQRSLSIKKGLAIIPPNDSKTRGKVGSAEGRKKWNIFGTRRRDANSNGSSSGAGKISWLPRRSKDGQASDKASQRSETPPPIPRDILQNIENNIQAASQVHPALRNRVQQTVMHDESSLRSLSSPNTPTHTAAMPPGMTRLAHPESQNMGIITASVAPSLSSSFERRAAGGELLSADRCKLTPDPFMQSPSTPAYYRSIEDMRRPLLYRAEDEAHEWDRCSLREAKSTASLR